MEDFKRYIEELKSRTNIVDIAGKIGLKLDSDGKTRCFLPGHEDHNPSLQITQNGDGGYYFCYGCEQWGDAITMVQQVKRMEFVETCNFLAQECGIEPLSASMNAYSKDEYDREIESYLTHRRERETVDKVLTEAAEYYHRELPEYLREIVLKAKSPPLQINEKDPSIRLELIHRWMQPGEVVPKSDMAYRLGISRRHLYRIMDEFVKSDEPLPEIHKNDVTHPSRLDFEMSQSSVTSDSEILHQDSENAHRCYTSNGVSVTSTTSNDPPNVTSEDEKPPSFTVYGLSDQTIEELKIGFSPNNERIIEYLCSLGFTQNDLLLSGLFVKVSEDKIVPFFKGRLMFPYWKNGRVVYFIGRETFFTDDNKYERDRKYKKLLTHSEKRPYISKVVSNKYFYNEDAAYKAKEILITEGVTDCIAAKQAGIPCISPVTTSFRDRDLPKLLELTKRCESVYICNDVEENKSGEKGAVKTALKLEEAGRNVYIVTLPSNGSDKVDLNDFLKQNPPGAFRELMDNADCTLDHLLKSLPEGTTPAEIRDIIEPIIKLLASSQYYTRVDEVLDTLKKKYKKLKKTKLEKEIKKLHVEHLKKTLIRKRGDKTILEWEGNRDDEATRLLKHYLQNNLPSYLFLYCGELTTVIKRFSGCDLKVLNTKLLRGVIERDFGWIVPCGERITDFNPPDSLYEQVLSRVLLENENWTFPVIEGVTRNPIYTESGELAVTNGYHGRLRTWVDLGDLKFPPVPNNPTEQDVKEARELLYETFHEFPFMDGAGAEGAGFAHTLALALYPLIRPLVKGLAPLTVIDAPAPGTGKSFLINLISIITTGRSIENRPPGKDETEWAKSILSALRDTPTYICYDNQNKAWKLDSGSLALALTSKFYKNRILGESHDLAVPNVASWVVTGNNITLSNELADRAIYIRLDAGLEQPSERIFENSSREATTIEKRPALLYALCVLVNNWLSKGRPPGSARHGRYPQWAEVISGILELAGIKNFLANKKRLFKSAESEIREWRTFCQEWYQQFGEEKVTAKKLCTLLQEQDSNDITRLNRNELLQDVLGSKIPISTRSFAKLLKGQEDRPFCITVDEGELTVHIRIPGTTQKNALEYQLERKVENDIF